MKNKEEFEKNFICPSEQIWLEQGIEKNKAEVAKSMLEKNLDLKLISEVIKLTEKEINDIKLQK